MPYLKDGRKKELLTEPQRANTDGDYNFLFMQEYLKSYINKPSYSTIALIRKASITPSKVEGVKAIEDLLTVQGVSQLDRIVARDLAFQEFYRRIGSMHEEEAQMSNGDVELFDEALRVMLERFTR